MPVLEDQVVIASPEVAREFAHVAFEPIEGEEASVIDVSNHAEAFYEPLKDVNGQAFHPSGKLDNVPILPYRFIRLRTKTSQVVYRLRVQLELVSSTKPE